MKKRAFFTVFLLHLFYLVNAQEVDSTARAIQKNAEAIGQGGVNEIKFNLLNAVIGIPEISYERLVEDNLGVGLSVLVGIGDDLDYYRFGVIPHFRVYFGSKKASGFFVEANTGIMNVTERTKLYYDFYTGYRPPRERQIVFGLGAAAGAKFLSRNGFLGEAFVGLGRFFGDNTLIDAYPRVGITLGKRF